MEILEKVTKKIQNKQNVSQQEFDEVISLYCNNQVSDEEFLPFVQAIYYYGLCDKELFYLTNSMQKSGATLDLTSLGQVVDKHSTGGVSDTTTIVIAPICACLGTKMLKLSGKALGFTGGTADKLEMFEGYQTELPLDKAMELVKQNGACMLTTSKDIAPADKKIYALRDRTGLVDNIPLIASSIMSKKLAGGADIIVIDVKYGNGAFMQTKKDAKKLAKKMKAIGRNAGRTIVNVLTKSNQPLGYNIGPKLEAIEAIEILKGEKYNSLLYKACIHLAATCVKLDKKISYHKAKNMVKEVLQNGSALQKLKDMVVSQGGKLDLFEQSYDKPTLVVKSPKVGKIKKYNTKEIGNIVGSLSRQNPDYGVVTFAKIGCKVNKDTTLFNIYAKDTNTAELTALKLLECVEIK